jgi:hypothetical protein
MPSIMPAIEFFTLDRSSQRGSDRRKSGSGIHPAIIVGRHLRMGCAAPARLFFSAFNQPFIDPQGKFGFHDVLIYSVYTANSSWFRYPVLYRNSKHFSFVLLIPGALRSTVIPKLRPAFCRNTVFPIMERFPFEQDMLQICRLTTLSNLILNILLT